MLLGIVCVALIAAPAWAAITPRDLKRADQVYQERLEEYLSTVPRAVAEEARMSVVRIPNQTFLRKRYCMTLVYVLIAFFKVASLNPFPISIVAPTDWYF